MAGKRWAIVMTAAVLGGGTSFAVGACGEDEGGVVIEGSTTGSGTSTTGVGTSTTPTTGTSTTPTTGTETVETSTTER